MKKNTIIKNTIRACETETTIANARTDKHNAKQDLVEYFNANNVIADKKTGVITTTEGKAFVKAFQDEAAAAYFATGNITMSWAKEKVRDFVCEYCGYRLRAPQEGREKSKNQGKVVRAQFNEDKTIVVINGVTYAKVK